MALTEEVRLRELWKYLWFFRIMSLKKGAVGKRIILPLHIFGRLPAGVHFSSRFSAALDVSTMVAGNFPPCARWSLLFLHLAGVHFLPVSPPIGRFDDAGGDFASVCTLAPAFLHLAGVHFSSHFSSDLAVSTMPAGILPPCARWPLLFLASPACIFYSISPPPWPFRRCRRAISLRVHAGTLPFFISPACIFLPVSPPTWPFRL